MHSKLPNHTPRFSQSICFYAFVLAAFCITASCTLADGATPKSAGLGDSVELGGAETEELLRRSIELIEGRHSISAEVTHYVDLFGKKLVGKGIYREERSGPHPLVRFELKTSTADLESSLLQVCDGKDMWIKHVLMGQARLDRIDLDRLAKAVQKQGRVVRDGVVRDGAVRGGTGQGGVGQGGAGLSDTITLGGMPGLLRSLQESFQFVSAENAVLYSMPVWKLRGRWQESKLAAFLPEQAEAIQQGRVALAGGEVDLARLPKHLPDHLVVWLGKDDLFPYRIEYCRRETVSGESRAIVAMQLLKVSFNVPLDPKCFVFEPDEVPVADRTSEYIAKMARRGKAAERR